MDHLEPNHNKYVFGYSRPVIYSLRVKHMCVFECRRDYQAYSRYVTCMGIMCSVCCMKE